MGKYIVRRLLQMIPVVLGATFIIFVMVFALPGDPTSGKCGERPCSAEYVAKFREEHNLNDSLPVQYGKYLGKFVQGDLGTNYYGIPVKEDLAKRYTITGRLAIMAILFETIIGVLAGVLAGVRKGRFIDNLVTVSTLFVISIPVFVIGVFLQYLVGIKWGIVEPTVPSLDAPTASLILPAFVLGSLSIAYVARLTRTNLVENLRADYVRTAAAKGLTRTRAVGVHTLRNSLIPVVTFIGADFGGLLGGAIVTERIFNIQGVGGYIWKGINSRDGVAVVSAVTVLVIVYLLVNLLVDLLYGVLDPRISHD
ncbi:putative peptide ABC transporter, permease component [Janibacter sp. HTCC2649]|uniref:ABC transporter permease n=1 Tax=Janibacter sp. HTCC2649 TaxID=313589 RepID=UPI0000670BBC|nr:ABC transporter permease [Janibacter sp. HTCC2649]EAP99952.1 putative peptide ABC transporter, permease component [Janibacter sp. HTCC2649]